MSEYRSRVFRPFLLEKRWLALLVFVGCALGAALFQLQLILWMRGFPLICPASSGICGAPPSGVFPAEAMGTRRFRAYVLQNKLNDAVLSWETKFPWRMRLWRANRGDEWALRKIVEVAGVERVAVSGFDQTPGAFQKIEDYKEAQQALLNLTHPRGREELQKIISNESLNVNVRGALIANLTGAQAKRMAPALQGVALLGAQSYHHYLSAAASRALLRAGDPDLNKWVKLHRVADAWDWTQAAGNCDERLIRGLPNPEEGRSVLGHAAIKGCLGAVEALLERGVDPNATSAGTGRRTRYLPTPLEIAAGKGDLKMTTLLFSHGAKISWYAVTDAARENHLEMVKWLITNGAHPGTTDMSVFRSLQSESPPRYTPEIKALLDKTVASSQRRPQ